MCPFTLLEGNLIAYPMAPSIRPHLMAQPLLPDLVPSFFTSLLPTLRFPSVDHFLRYDYECPFVHQIDHLGHRTHIHVGRPFPHPHIRQYSRPFNWETFCTTLSDHNWYTYPNPNPNQLPRPKPKPEHPTPTPTLSYP